MSKKDIPALVGLALLLPIIFGLNLLGCQSGRSPTMGIEYETLLVNEILADTMVTEEFKRDLVSALVTPVDSNLRLDESGVRYWRMWNDEFLSNMSGPSDSLEFEEDCSTGHGEWCKWKVYLSPPPPAPRGFGRAGFQSVTSHRVSLGELTVITSQREQFVRHLTNGEVKILEDK